MKRFCQNAMLLLIGMYLAFVAPSEGYAASAVSWSATTKAGWDKLVADADAARAAKLKSMAAELASLQQQEASLDARIQSAHDANAKETDAVRQRIKTINAAKLSAMATQTKQVRSRNQPILDQYTKLNKQISTARSLGSKTIRSALQTEANLLKPLVQIARDNIRNQTAAEKSLKDATSKTAKTIRATLAGADSSKKQIAAEKKSVTSNKASISSSMKTFNQAVKKKDPAGASSSLSSILSYYRQLNGHKEKIYGHERDIAAILVKAKGQFPAS
ncbi:hypothetical protein [Cohnella zeiphila]|uniref:Uncharacterized protein n=1 Tax=Cohnella zeiphila TaxID=2761120 RepID=A0A7X0SKN9_9BACL|nr:hypothetical protein [Cohnella zeiphila]MBB6731780.1 hypothetical protein [Cohnella zeiphila]